MPATRASNTRSIVSVVNTTARPIVPHSITAQPNAKFNYTNFLIPFDEQPQSTQTHSTFDHSQFVLQMPFSWQTLTIYSDRVFTSADMVSIPRALYNTMVMFTHIFQFNKQSLDQANLPANAYIYAFQDKKSFVKFVQLNVNLANPELVCGVFSGETMYVLLRNDNGCQYIDTIKHEYAHYLNQFLLKLGDHLTPAWWNEGLAQYASNRSVRNNQSGATPLKAMLLSKKNCPTTGLILHSFLDSTPILNNYHNMLVRKMQKGRSVTELIDRIATAYGHRFKVGMYGSRMNKWLQQYFFAFFGSFVRTFSLFSRPNID